MDLDKSQKALLRRLYYNANSASQFAGVDRLLRAAHKVDTTIKNKHVEKFLSEQNTYTRHRKAVRRYPRLRTIPCGLHTNWQADLAQFDKFSDENDGNAYLLVCIDVLSRKIFVEPVKSKKSKDMIKAFDAIFKRAQVKPWKLFTDQGVEFNAKLMLKYFDDLLIIKQCAFTNPIIHASIVERSIRTIKERLFRYLFEHGTTRWLEIIQKVVEAINNSVNRTNGCAPNAVTFENSSRLWKHVYGSLDVKQNHESKLKVGDHVRIERQKGNFEKGYYPNFTDEIFTISEVHAHRTPIVYRIVDAFGETIKGWFYAQDLCKTKKNTETEYRIEKILKSRKSQRKGGGKELFVKWLGYDNSYNRWIHEKDLDVNY